MYASICKLPVMLSPCRMLHVGLVRGTSYKKSACLKPMEINADIGELR